jgi:N-acetylglucosamine-6-phosphate deacetylase
MHLLTAPSVVADGRLCSPGWLLLDDTVREYGEGRPPTRVQETAGETAALAEGVLAPGLVDMQINGAFGVDFAAADDEDWRHVARMLPSTGTTAYVPTLITAPLDDLAAALRGYRDREADLHGTAGAARSLGMHLEGPFLADRRRGAHRSDLLRDPRPADLDRLVEAGDGRLLYVTLAPERDGAIDAVRRLTSRGVRVAVGHTDAEEQSVRAAADAGATLLTHLYNAQRPLHHRDPGTVGAGLTDDRLTCGLIADLHHVAATAVRVAFRCATGRLALVTDAVAAMGMPVGSYELGGERVEVRPGEPPMRADGTIAGSALRMDEAVANAVRHCGVDLLTAVEAATRVPAAAVGRPDLGTLAPGSPADVVWLDHELRARATWVGGGLVWSHDEPGLPVQPRAEASR